MMYYTSSVILRKNHFMGTTEDTFREWLDSVSLPLPSSRYRTCDCQFIRLDCDTCKAFLRKITSPKSLDERLAEKEKRIKRKIEASLRRQGKLGKRYEANRLPMDVIDEWLTKKLQPKKSE